VSFLVLRPLKHLDVLIGALSQLDRHPSLKDTPYVPKSRASPFREVRLLQDTFESLGETMESLGRFVSVGVGQDVAFSERHRRLHVEERVVTIMFSDVQDFTRMCETLPARDLLFVITRYLSVMTRIVEMYSGTVGEILGDGLLVFWNTPIDVPDHATKACDAALAQHKAVQLLNMQFDMLGQPQLAIRIGLHTGPALSGNIGTETRMKFGCTGDAVNVASRLENLCKQYEVGVIVSGGTHDAVSQDAGLSFRYLDVVTVKGKARETQIYELLDKEVGEHEVTPSTAACDMPSLQSNCVEDGVVCA